jgi:hypothetical protein
MADTAPYTRQALVRDLIRLISAAEGKELAVGFNRVEGKDRAYITQVANHAIDIVNRLTAEPR